MNQSLKRAHSKLVSGSGPTSELVRPIIETAGAGAQQAVKERRNFISLAEYTVGAGQITSVDATVITGLIVAGQIAANSITANHIQVNSINAGHITALAIDAGHIQADAINAGHIQALTIDANHVKANAISAGHIAANSINAGHVQALAIDAGHIKALAINAGHIQADAINAGHIAVGTIDAGHIKALAIDATHIAAGAVEAGHIKALTIDTTHLNANVVTADKIAANTITANQIAANTITGNEIFGTTLSAITSDLGSITAGSITGGTIQTASSGSRVIMDSLGLRGYALDGVTKVFEISSGSGVASFTGIATLDADSVVPTGTLSGFLSGGNIVPNSSFEQGTNTDTGVDQWSEGWETSTGTLSKNTSLNVHGSNSATLTATSASNPWVGRYAVNDNMLRIRPNRRYYISAYTRAATTARNIRLVWYWRDSARTILASGVSTEELNSTTEFKRISTRTDVAPANAVYLSVLVQVMSAALNEAHHIDAIQVEEGDTLTAYQPLATEILYSSIRSVFIGAGQIKANNIEAGAIQAQHIKVSFGGSQVLQNAKFDYWPATDPWEWARYDNGATGTKTWSKVASGGPNGENSWRLQTATTNMILGFRSASQHVVLPNVTYVQSWWWKGDAQPNIASNTSWALNEWIENPTVSATTWQRYSKRLRSSTGGGMAGGKDWAYFYTPAGTSDVQIALPQWEAGEFPSAHAPKVGEVLPDSVGPTQITPDSITADRLKTGTITAASGIIADAAITNAKIVSIDAGKITTGFLDAARIEAGTITASHLTVGFSGGNRLLNSNLNDDIEGRLTLTTRWYGPYEASSPARASGPTYPGGYAIYASATGTGGGAHFYTPMTQCGFQSKVTCSISTHSASSRVRRIVVQFYDSGGSILISTATADSASLAGWQRSVAENIAVPSNAYYVRFYAVLLGTVADEQVHWAAAQIEFSEKVTSWALAPEDLAPGAVTETKIEPGSITTGLISADGITGKTIRTALSGTRIELSTDGFKQFIGAATSPAIHFKTDGSDTNVFTGVLSARGVEIPTAIYSGEPGTVERVRWLRGASEIAQLYAIQESANSANTLMLRVYSDDKSANSYISMAQNAGTTKVGDVRVTVSKAPAAGVGQFSLTLLDQLGRSGFPQLSRSSSGAVPISYHMNSGSHTYTFAAAQSATVSVTHDMKVTPDLIIMTQNADPATVPPVTYQAYNISSTGFSVRCWSVLGATSATDKFTWLAIKNA